MPNGLYSQFMSDVADLTKHASPELLKIKKCYQTFQEGRSALDEVFILQRKDNRTAALSDCDKRRDNYYRCVAGHAKADLLSPIVEKREKAQVLVNKIEAAGYLPGMGNNEKSARMSDLTADLMASPYKEIVELLGLTVEVKEIDDANRRFINLSRERTESNKSSSQALKGVRRQLDNAYRNMISVINSQLTIHSLMDEVEDDGPVVVRQEKQDTSSDPLNDYVLSLNAIIREYKTKINQSGSRPSKEEETPVV